MGFFDFLADKQAPQPGQTDADGLTHPPTVQTQPGLLTRMRTPDAHGLTFGDKLALAGAALRDDADPTAIFQARKNIEQQAMQQRKEQQALQDRARKNAAFKAAYQGGKFDPSVYASNLDNANVDPSDIAELTRAFAPKAGVDGGVAYTQDPDGTTHWGAQRPMSYAEQQQIAREEEVERHNREMERLGGINAGANAYRAHKAPASAKGATSGAGMAAVEAELRRRGLLQ